MGRNVTQKVPGVSLATGTFHLNVRWTIFSYPEQSWAVEVWVVAWVCFAEPVLADEGYYFVARALGYYFEQALFLQVVAERAFRFELAVGAESVARVAQAVAEPVLRA